MGAASNSAIARVSSVKQSAAVADEDGQNSDPGSLKATNEDRDLPKNDSAALESSSPLSPRRSTESVTIETGARRYKKRWLKRAVVLYPVALGIALVSLLVVWLHARIKRPPAPPAPPIEVPTEALLDKFIEKFVTEIEPTCFLHHKSFAGDSSDARTAKRSFMELVGKAQHWRDSLKAPAKSPAAAAAEAAAAAARRGSIAPPAGPPEGPSPWEAAYLRGALTCYHLPFLEEQAGFCPYFPLHYGNFKYTAPEGGLVLLSGPAVDKEREQELREGQHALRENAEQVAAWVSTMLDALKEVQATTEARLPDIPPGEVEETEEILKEVNRAVSFYESLLLFAERRTPPPPPEDGIPAPEDLRAADLFILKAANAAERAYGVLAAPEVEMDSFTGREAESGDEGPNRFLPPWVAQLVISRQKDVCIDCVKLRLQVASAGLPSFATACEGCLDDFIQLLNDTLTHEQDKQRLDSVPLGSPERSDLERKLVLTEMHAELAAAAGMIDYQKRAISQALEREDVSKERQEALHEALVDAYTHLSGCAYRWMGAAKGGRIPIARADAETLAVALQHLVNVTLLSRRVALVREDSTEKMALSISTNLQAVCKMQLAQAAKGPLRKKGILPKWFQNLV